jgi:hypothetical protein
MKKRLLNINSLLRATYMLIGIIVSLQAANAELWWGLAFGIYIAAMGFFGFGCAAGNCTRPNCTVEPDRNQEKRK